MEVVGCISVRMVAAAGIEAAEGILRLLVASLLQRHMRRVWRRSSLRRCLLIDLWLCESRDESMLAAAMRRMHLKRRQMG